MLPVLTSVLKTELILYPEEQLNVSAVVKFRFFAVILFVSPVA